MALREIQSKRGASKYDIICGYCGNPIKRGYYIFHKGVKGGEGFEHLECVWKEIESRRVIRPITQSDRYRRKLSLRLAKQEQQKKEYLVD